MAYTRETLDELTAKALRPIAAELNVTGASRMKKDEIIAAILRVEAALVAADERTVVDGDAAFKRGQERYIAERTPAEEYFVRATRRGTETVVVGRVHNGRVHYRIIDAKTGRRSAMYYMRELTFRAQYVKVPS